MESRDEARLEPVHIELWCPNGPELPWQVTTLRGEEQLGQPFEFELHLRCEDANADIEAVLGADVELLIERSGLTRIVYGVIVEVEVEVPVLGTPDHDGVAVRVVVAPAFWLLAQEHDTRIHAGQTVLEILAERLGESLDRYGRKLDVESRIAGSYAQRDYCVQFRESTFDFCSRLMEEEGIAYVFMADAESQREVMVLVDNNEAYAAVELLATEPLVVVSHAPEQLEHESLQRLDWRSRRTSNRVRSRGYNYKLPKRIDEGQAEAPDRHNPDVRELALEGERRQIIDDPIHDPEAQHFTGAELDQRGRAAQLLLQRHQLDASVGHGRSNAGTFAAGGVFELAEAIRGVQGSELLLTKVVHQAHRDDQGDRYEYANRFECVPRSLPFRPARVTFKPRVYGVLTGVVLGRGTDEVYTDALGRVRVRLHGDRHAETDEPRTCWIRVAQMWAGSGYGAMVLPRAGMEVVISFVDGNPDCPLITGCVYNGENPPPRPLPAELSRSTFKSSTTPGGEGFNELMIEDAKGREQIFVHAQKRMDVRVRQAAYETVLGHKELHIGPAGDGQSDVGDYNVRIRHNFNQQVEGDSYSFIRGDKYEVGTMMVSAFDAYTFWSPEAEFTMQNCVMTVKEHSSHAAQTMVLSASELLSMVAGERVVIESNNHIDLKVGDSFITISREGVDIVGPMIRLNSGGSAWSAEAAKRVADSVDAYYPIYADVADDGRPGGRSGGSSRARQIRRSNQVNEKDTFNPPDLVPPREPLPRVKDIERIQGERDLIGIAWAQPSMWCSETANIVGSFDKTGEATRAELFLNEAPGGSTLRADWIEIGPGRTLSTPVSVSGVLPREADGKRETERLIHAELGGLRTPEPVGLKFLNDLPHYAYRSGYTRFNVWMENGVAYFGGTIEYVRGWIYYIVDLTPYSEEKKGRIGLRCCGHKNWWYAKRRFEGADFEKGYPQPHDLLYWDGEAWCDMPRNWASPIGTRLYGNAVWRENDEVKTQRGRLPWPDPVPHHWPADRDADLAKQLAQWKTDAERYWSQKFKLKRATCKAEDPCCLHELRCQVDFREVDAKRDGVIVIAANDARANSSAWNWSIKPHVVAHEVGHHFGNPDEYPGARSLDPTVKGDGAYSGIDYQGLMGCGDTMRARYYDTLALALGFAVREAIGIPFPFVIK